MKADINEEKTPQWSYVIHIVIASSLIESELVKSYWCLAFKYIIQKPLSFFYLIKVWDHKAEIHKNGTSFSYTVFCLFRLSYTALMLEVLTKRRPCTYHRFYIPARRENTHFHAIHRHRIIYVGRDFLRLPSPTPSVQEGSARAGCPELCTDRFWVSPWMDTPLWANYSFDHTHCKYSSFSKSFLQANSSYHLANFCLQIQSNKGCKMSKYLIREQYEKHISKQEQSRSSSERG